MSMLPEVIAQWRPLLAFFDADVVTALAPMLDRLSRAIGPMASDAGEPTGDPAGYDGVATRGIYERLLPSEWLLADELPDEFVRRAVAREHLFYALARERPRGRRATTVVVDVGPELFGTPRIAALATLLVLAHRAAGANASFTWSAAQSTDVCSSDMGADAVRTFLGARARFELTKEALQPTLDSLRAHGEAWVIAGPRAARAADALGASTVTIEDVIEPDTRALSLRVRSQGRPARDVRLELPADDDCVRVLRDPFPRRAPAALVQRAQAPFAAALPVVSASRACVFARLVDGRVFMLPLPKSKKQDLGHGRFFDAAGVGEIVAAGHLSGKPALVAQHEHDLTLLTWKTKANCVRRLGRANEPLRPPPMDGRLFPLFAIAGAIVFVGRGGRLLELRPGNRVRVLTGDCCAIARMHVGDGATVIVPGDSSSMIRSLRAATTLELTAPWMRVPSERPLVASTDLGGIVCAYERADGDWMVGTLLREDLFVQSRKRDAAVGELGSLTDAPRSRVVRVGVARGAEVVGVLNLSHRGAGHPKVEARPALVSLDPEGRRLRVEWGEAGHGYSIALPERVVRVAVDAITRTAACITDTGELLIVAFDWRAVFARFTASGRVA